MIIDPDSPDAPRQLAARAGTLLVALKEMGIRPLLDPVDLLLISLLPAAIKQILTGDPFADAPEIKAMLDQIDLTVLRQLIYGDRS